MTITAKENLEDIRTIMVS